MKDKILNIILLLIMVCLMSIVGFLGYIIYNEIKGEETIIPNFIGKVEEPRIETEEKQSITEKIYTGETVTTNTQTTIEEKGTVEKVFYNQLSSDAKIIYDKLYKNKEKLKTGTYQIDFGNKFSDMLSEEGGEERLQREYQSAIEAFLYENPDVFYLEATSMYINIIKTTKITGTKYNVYINSGTKPHYLIEGLNSKEDVDKCEMQIDVEKQKILLLLQDKNEYQKIKILHDYLIENIEYDSSLLGKNIYNIYGALVDKKCVCEGYAKAFQYIMNEIGMQNVIAIGTGRNSQNETESHAWNYVKLDGSWYAVDVTWDDPVIIGGGTLTKELKYKYFLKGEYTISKNHTLSGQFTENGQIFEYPKLSITDY